MTASRACHCCLMLMHAWVALGLVCALLSTGPALGRVCLGTACAAAICIAHASGLAARVPRGTHGCLLSQVSLGIATLWSYVRPELGASHQATALALFTVALALLHSVQGSSGPSALSRMVGPAAAVGVAGVAVAVSSLQ